MSQSSAALDPLRAGAAAAPQSAEAEAAHLRSLIEKQPSCLMRVGVDGRLLAINDAALSLLGARDLGPALRTNLIHRLAPGQYGWWHEFAGRVVAGGSASGECEMRDLSGAERTVVMQGRALPDHPDGIPSLLVAVRDISAMRRLEASLRQHEAERAKLQQQMAEEHQLALLEREREARHALTARADVERVGEQQQQLRAALEASQAEVQRLRAVADEAQAGQQRLERRVAEAEAGQRELEAMIEQTLADQKAFQKVITEREAERKRLVTQLVSARIAAERALADARAELEHLRNATVPRQAPPTEVRM